MPKAKPVRIKKNPSTIRTTLAQALVKPRTRGPLSSRVPTDAEIERAANDDPDAPLLTDAQLAGGTSHVARTKVAISLRLDPEIIEAFRATGAGWQSRMNDVLYASIHPPRMVAEPLAALDAIQHAVDQAAHTIRHALGSGDRKRGPRK